MEKVSKEKNEIFLPTSLINDIEYDELDKELEFTQNSERNSSINKSKNINFLFWINSINLVTKNLIDNSYFPNEKKLINNDNNNNINLFYSVKNESNKIHYSNHYQNLFYNSNNIKESVVSQNIKENSNNNNSMNKYAKFDIIYFLENNQDINFFY